MSSQIVKNTGKFLRQIEVRRNHAGVTPNEVNVLWALSMFETPVGRTEIAEINGYSIGGVDSKTTASLVKDGRITKTRVPITGRKSYSYKNDLEITEKGRKLISLIFTGKESV
jgi:DNA-binding MarR family transcriptional regulator